MDNIKIIIFIEKAIADAKEMSAKDNSSAMETIKVLQLLLTEVKFNLPNIRKDVLRAMHDVGLSSFKEFENTPLEEAINNITEWLFLAIPQYKRLTPLGSDFIEWVNDL